MNTDTPRIYIACLASYNAGTLHGRWIDVDDVETMQEEIAEMLRESPCPNVQVTCPDCENGSGGENVTRETPILHTTWRNCETCKGTGTVPSAEEYAVHDYDGLPSSFGEYPDLAELVEYVEAVDSFYSESERDAFRAWLDDEQGRKPDVDAFREDYRGTYDTKAAAAEEFTEETGGLEGVPESIRYHIDWDSVAREMEQSDMWFARTDSGVAMFWRN